MGRHIASGVISSLITAIIIASCRAVEDRFAGYPFAFHLEAFAQVAWLLSASVLGLGVVLGLVWVVWDVNFSDYKRPPKIIARFALWSFTCGLIALIVVMLIENAIWHSMGTQSQAQWPGLW